MTNQGNQSRKFLTTGIALILFILLAAGIFAYRSTQQQQIVDKHALVDEGIAQFRAEQYELSVQTLGSIPEDSIDDWHIPYYMGSALINLKDYEAGAKQLESALALNPDEVNTLFALGVVYYKLGNLSLSKAYFASVLKIDPRHEEAKGLMDIMASLERQQPGASQQESSPDNDSGSNDH